jgi:hypothetical protein
MMVTKKKVVPEKKVVPIKEPEKKIEKVEIIPEFKEIEIITYKTKINPLGIIRILNTIGKQFKIIGSSKPEVKFIRKSISYPKEIWDAYCIGWYTFENWIKEKYYGRKKN